MKKILLFACVWLLVLPGPAAAQSVKITATPPPVVATLNGEKTSLPVKFSKKKLNDFIVVSKKGYITQAALAEQVLNEAKEEFTFAMEKIHKPASGFKSLKIEFSKMVDGTDKLAKTKLTYNFWYYGVTEPVNLSDPKYKRAADEALSQWGFDMVSTNAMFDENSASDLAIAGELMAFGRDTEGPGFQASILVSWSVYDKKKKEVVMTLSTGGYSDSQSEVEFSDELTYAIKDALAGLMSHKQFQELAIRN
jgi:hypothetical protein